MMGWIIGGVALAAALALAGVSRWRTARLMARLEEMLDAAIRGDFSPETFDESRLSSLENRLARYLSASTLSARSLQAQRDEIAALVSDISHQTKTPVANLRLYTQLLEEEPLTPRGRDCAAALESQGEKLQNLVDALVKASRLETGILALYPEQAPLAPLVEGAVAQYALKAKEKKITLLAPQAEGSACFDPKWTEEALCNLLDNALKYTPAGGKVEVSVEAYPLFAALRVKDNGPGIPEEEQPRIFGRFYRGAAARQTQGVGIGLYLARQIAEKQGGYIKVESREGKGSTFSLYLPREKS